MQQSLIELLEVADVLGINHRVLKTQYVYYIGMYFLEVCLFIALIIMGITTLVIYIEEFRMKKDSRYTRDDLMSKNNQLKANFKITLVVFLLLVGSMGVRTMTAVDYILIKRLLELM